MTTREMIEKAFADVPHPGDNIITHDCPECEELWTFLREKSWHDLKFPELHNFHSSLPLLSDRAVLYFLPGYMLAALEHWDQIDMIPYSIIQIGGYHDDAWNVKDEARENRKVFTMMQRQAIAAWLIELGKFGPPEWRLDDDRDIEYAVEKILTD
ncbi:MAG TPA: DUF6714 family protein [Candidatus Methylacidiphilales bacterium]|nr:DUF6714 family protein [Candidatus Methylacidiphilales bacterium]